MRIMRLRKNLCGMITVFLLVVSFSSYTSQSSRSGSHNPNTFDLIKHNSIEIYSDQDFDEFRGTGSKEDPFIIENFNITTNNDYGIYIISTTKCFIIRECYIDSSYIGIFIDGVAEGTVIIENNFCVNSETANGIGIRVENTNNATILGNFCGFNYLSGIAVLYSNNIIITNNICKNNGGEGLVLFVSNSSILENNLCTKNEGAGLATVVSHLCKVFNNSCTQNELGAIMVLSSNLTILYNKFTENFEYGMYFRECENNIVSYNYITKNEDYGVMIDQYSENNYVYYNNFITNCLTEGHSQAKDVCNNNFWFNSATEMGNYWSDNPELNVYRIDGTEGIFDLFPSDSVFVYVEEPILPTNAHFFSLIPIIVFVIIIIRRKK